MDKESFKGLSIRDRFYEVEKQKRIALIPFLMAGDPDLKTSGEILLSLQEAGADIIELGIPYSDPLADGPVIQAAASRAISVGTTPSKVLSMLSSLSEKLSTPIVLFTYCNPLLSYGMERFCDDAAMAGASGLVVPDLPLEEATSLSLIAESKGIDLILLVAPTSPLERIEKISSRSKGFTYLVSVTGVTGERSIIDERVHDLVKQVKNISSGPVAVGFGISGSDQIKQVKRFGADGAIVGSALVKRISLSKPRNASIEAGQFCSELFKATSID